jgi:glycosyltransferase involved in cell wall biosynthesis
MKILEVIRSLNPAGGGPIEGLKQIAAVLQRDGHIVEVASLDSPKEPFLDQFQMPIYPLGPGRGSYGFSPQFVPWIRKHAPMYDVVLVDGIWTFHSYGVWRALRKSATPYAVFTHGMLDPWFKRRYPLKHLKKWLYWPWAEYRVCRDAGAMLFTCEEERILARESFWLYRAKEVVVSYGAPEPEGHEDQQLSVFYRRFPELGGKRLAVFMSRIHPKKGCDIAIEAFAQTAAKDPSWRLVLAGPDQVGWQSSLQAETNRLGIADRVIWPGPVQGDMKWGLLRAAEVFLLPSHQENFGVVIAESLACGTPVIMSNKVNIYREIESAGAGLVGKDDLAATTSMLGAWTAMSASDRDRMRRRARECFASRFEIQRAAELLIAALQKVVSERTSSRRSFAALASANSD